MSKRYTPVHPKGPWGLLFYYVALPELGGTRGSFLLGGARARVAVNCLTLSSLQPSSRHTRRRKFPVSEQEGLFGAGALVTSGPETGRPSPKAGRGLGPSAASGGGRACLRWARSLAACESEEGGREEDAAWPGRPLQELAAASASAPGEGPPAAPRVRVGAAAAARSRAGSAGRASRRRCGRCPPALSPGPSL